MLELLGLEWSECTDAEKLAKVVLAILIAQGLEVVTLGMAVLAGVLVIVC